jgi:hypothetical protein
MEALSIRYNSWLSADRAQACEGDSHASSGIDVACTTTQSALAIALPHELHEDSWPSSSTGTGTFCCNQHYSITAIASNWQEIQKVMIEGGCCNCTLIWMLVFSIVAMGCRPPQTDLEDYVHRNISVEEFQFDKSIQISMGSRLAVPPGLHVVLFQFSGDDSIYDLAAKPKVSVRQSFADGSRGKSETFDCSVTIFEVSGETIVTISSSILIDSSLREKRAFIEIFSGAGTLIARKTMFVTFEGKKKDIHSD